MKTPSTPQTPTATEDLILGSWLGINVTRQDLEHAAQTLFNETYGDIQSAESGRTYTLWLDNDLTPDVQIGRQSGEYVEADGTVISKPILSFDFETECDMDDEDNLTAWQENYDEGQAGQIDSWVVEMTASLDETVAAESE